MVDGVLDLLSTVAVVVVVGVAALGLLSVDLVRRELAGSRSVGVHYRAYGVATAVVFLALVILRFVTLGR
jgi:hypothetical protein